MSYVIGSDCIDVLDRSCVDVCPVDCIYEGDRKSYIQPDECIDCGACEVECPVTAIVVDRKARKDPDLTAHLDDSRTFFDEPLPGRAEPIGSPGGAQAYGVIGADTPLVADWSA
ncbi:ferredoxin [Nocardioides soli]|uniref:Ferredoxin n=1 Tax=Nocardioides soli TaxID=1036020 RepID=A0A7W4VVP6_9ACTN|nr:ferredoxin [Nocardioides soli]MBB3042639.1 NAD-dependent dihydropyrimidine dehydrogenase PreA subunit [Nocardioides soli]